MQLEIRQVPGLEVRADEENGTTIIAGRGIPYGEWSEDLGGFRERLMPGTFRASIADDDIRALFNHDSNIVLGRKSTGTLRLEEREEGVLYEVDVNQDDSDALNAVARIRRGDISGNSFGFFIGDNGREEWEERDGIIWRTIHEATLRELGPQTFPAYPQSDVSVRSAEAVLEEARRYLEDRVSYGDPELLRLRNEEVARRLRAM